MPETETIDRLFLELSQFTGATTALELHYRKACKEALRHMKDVSRNGPAIRVIAILEGALAADKNADP